MDGEGDLEKFWLSGPLDDGSIFSFFTTFLWKIATGFNFEKDFSGDAWVKYTAGHVEIMAFSASAYLVLVNVLPQWVNEPWTFLNRTQGIWNGALALFSFFGFIRVVPVLISKIISDGVKYTICTSPHVWYLEGASGLWVTLFIYSKIAELLDTIFLVLRKKKVIFLHWFHHLTVLCYCWHAFSMEIGPGIWFAGMNFTVHSIMYFYYFMANIGLFWVVAPIAPFVTSLQLMQMWCGMCVLLKVSYTQYHEGFEACPVDRGNLKIGLMMYFLYFLLFVELFVEKYCLKRRALEPCIAGETADAMEFMCTPDPADGRAAPPPVCCAPYDGDSAYGSTSPSQNGDQRSESSFEQDPTCWPPVGRKRRKRKNKKKRDNLKVE